MKIVLVPLSTNDLRLGAIAAAFYADELRRWGEAGEGAAADYDDVSSHLEEAYDKVADNTVRVLSDDGVDLTIEFEGRTSTCVPAAFTPDDWQRYGEAALREAEFIAYQGRRDLALAAYLRKKESSSDMSIPAGY